ncbi:hypothetical protein Athai_62160 [Actinocatenispora thailandica]|uniref:Uncharacterized protein n=1 Tax=Actinocatenispora thailandica TaxID=227318 RepID=A0A7R7DVN5_9ACTN|nr:DUF6624 domain-containing protein [Actinocatenispora thailandica]BCJ38713.1 hypothetical protein Athai_62160 [Actinocatenispora thailandica]
MDDRLRAELTAMFEADTAAVTAFYAHADEHRARFVATGIVATTPWPFGLLEWSPIESAPPLVRQVVEVVHTNTARLRRIVAAHGWPGRSLVDTDGADAAWLVLQHASSGVPSLGTPENLAFCRACIPLLARAVRSGDAQPRQLAATVDSLRGLDGLPPVYAVLTSDYRIEDGRPEFRRPVQVADIDRERSRIGLPPLASDIRRRQLGSTLDPAGPGRAEPWPTTPARRGRGPE